VEPECRRTLWTIYAVRSAVGEIVERLVQSLRYQTERNQLN